MELSTTVTTNARLLTFLIFAHSGRGQGSAEMKVIIRYKLPKPS